MKSAFVPVATVLAALSFAACEIIDDQTKVRSEDLSVVNPSPLEATTREKLAIAQGRHRTLLAVIDSGVDYNHPTLINNIHFTLDKNGNPIGTGYDYTGEDSWPSPYIARTSVWDPEDELEDRMKAEKRSKAISSLLKADSDLASFLNDRRNVEQESASGAYHGTHVAGLMVYDRPDFGLLPYRVLGHNRKKGDTFGVEVDYLAIFQKNLLNALARSVEDGARVVNLSLGMDGDKPHGDEKEDWEKIQAFMKQLGSVLRSYPNTLFVVAAGNSGQWIDGKNRLTLPCNAESSNVLCVGSLDENLDPSGFTNFPLHSFDVVFALGENVLSTTPSKMCMSPKLDQSSLFREDTIEDPAAKAAELKTECSGKVGMSRLSGTSMASPLVARVAAEVVSENPQLDARGIIAGIMARAEDSRIGVVPVKKLRIRKPSWYATQITPGSDGKLGQRDETRDEMFELVIPARR